MSQLTAVSIAERWTPCHVDDIRCVLNPVQAASLECALVLLPAKRRIQIAMAVAGLEPSALAIAIDLVPPYSMQKNVQLWRWVTGEHKMPMGIGFRLARVFGVNAEVLCEGYI